MKETIVKIIIVLMATVFCVALLYFSLTGMESFSDKIQSMRTTYLTF